MTERPTHSPLGASSAERWMNCPGSNLLLKELDLPETDDPSYRREGTAMHLAAAEALNKGMDAWELAGQEFGGVKLDATMADAVGVYLDYVRPFMVGKTFGIEWPVSSPVHELFYGTADFWAVTPHGPNVAPNPETHLHIKNALRVVDFKGGEGIIIEAEENPQIKYYAFGVIDGLERARGFVFDDAMKVILSIAQPRGFHHDGPIREWETTVGEIKDWVHSTLVPAMARAEIDNLLEPGAWCRFCPAKLVCPMLNSLFRAAAVANPKDLGHLSDDVIGKSALLIEPVRFYIKALSDEVLRRKLAGRAVPGVKLVKQKANRVFTEEGTGHLLVAAALGLPVVSPPELLSPAAIDKLGAKGKAFTKEFAFTPDTSLKWVAETEPGVAVVVTKPSETFAGYKPEND